jgi:hypothetical protein
VIPTGLITQLAAWAADPAAGVNVQLPLVPRPSDQAAPPPVTVLDAYTDEQVANGLVDDQRRDAGPFLVIAPASTVRLAGVRFDGGTDTLDVVTLYLDGRSDAHVALRNGHRTLRAWRRVLALRWNALDNGGLDLEGCSIDPPTTLSVVTADDDPGAAQVTCMAFLSFPSTDRWALGAP